MLKEHKFWMENKKNKKIIINSLNKIWEGSDKNPNNLNNNSLLNKHKINLHLKINSSQLLSLTSHPTKKLTMDNICIIKDAKMHLKDPWKWGTLNSNNRSFPNKDKTKSTFNLQVNVQEKNLKWSKTFKKNFKIWCTNLNLSSVSNNKVINKNFPNKINFDLDLQLTSESNLNYHKSILLIKQQLSCLKFEMTVCLKKIFEEIELNLWNQSFLNFSICLNMKKEKLHHQCVNIQHVNVDFLKLSELIANRSKDWINSMKLQE